MATAIESALRRRAKRRGVDLMRSRIKDAGVVSFGKWSIVDLDTGDRFAGIKGSEPVWLDATPGNSYRTAWLDASDVERLLDETFTANPKRGLPVMTVTLPSPEIVATARRVHETGERSQNAVMALAVGASVKRSPILEVTKERSQIGFGNDSGRSELGGPGAGAACSTLDGATVADLRLQADIARGEQATAVEALSKAMDEIALLKAAVAQQAAKTERPALAVPPNLKSMTKPQLQESCAFMIGEARAAKDELAERKFGGTLAELNAGDLCEALDRMASEDVVDALQERFGNDLLKQWVRLAASEAGEGVALIEAVDKGDDEALGDAVAKLWTVDDLQEVYIQRRGQAPPDPQSEALHSLLWELQPAIDDVRAGMTARGVELATSWLKRAAFDPRVTWI